MRFKRFLSIALALTMAFSPVALSPRMVRAAGGESSLEWSENEQKVADFVTKAYMDFTGSPPSDYQLETWVKDLITVKKGALDLTDSLIDPVIFKDHATSGITNQGYVSLLCDAFLNGDYQSNKTSLDMFVSALDAEQITRDDVYYFFIFVDGFEASCKNIGIIPYHSIDKYIMYTTQGLLGEYLPFEERIRQKEKLASGELFGKGFVLDFLNNSGHGIEKLFNTGTNADFIEALYAGLRFTNPTDDELNNWVQKLKNGTTRSTVFFNFLSSDAYKDICEAHGIRYESTTPLNVNRFIDHAFNAILYTGPDESALTYWSTNLESNEKSALDLLETLYSTEDFLNLDMTDSEYIVSVYDAVYQKAPDEFTFDYLLDQLTNGKTDRDQILYDAVYSDEFNNTCIDLEILRMKPVDEFVLVSYKAFLDKYPSKSSRLSYAAELKSQTLTGSKYLESFIENPDSRYTKGSNQAFVKALYNGALFREPDPVDLDNWTETLNTGSITRKDLFYSFHNSDLGKGVIEYYGVVWEELGKAEPTPTSEPSPTTRPTSGPTATPTSSPKGSGAPTATPRVTATPKVTATPRVTATTAPTTVPTVTPEGATPTPTTAPVSPKSQIRDFVDRIYKYVLNRESEEEGAAFWTDELYNFKRSGAEVAQGFIFSDEFKNRNTADEEFVTILYNTFFGREPDTDGMNYWISQLKSGTMTREDVANGFIYSLEWANTCASYGIMSGGTTAPDINIEPTELTYAFVERMYTTAMCREAEEAGKEYWAKELSNFRISGEFIGLAFFLSDEMNGYNLNSTEFANRLYKTFMDREADADGLAYWVSVLDGGTPRQDVVMGFTHSEEFIGKCIEARIKPF